jgi:hypothetical protein
MGVGKAMLRSCSRGLGAMNPAIESIKPVFGGLIDGSGITFTSVNLGIKKNDTTNHITKMSTPTKSEMVMVRFIFSKSIRK